MIGRLLAAVIGAAVTWVALIVLDATSGDAQPKYLLAVALGAVATFVWPWIAGFIAVRRMRSRRDAAISREVDRRLADSDRR